MNLVYNISTTKLEVCQSIMLLNVFYKRLTKYVRLVYTYYYHKITTYTLLGN